MVLRTNQNEILVIHRAMFWTALSFDQLGLEISAPQTGPVYDRMKRMSILVVWILVLIGIGLWLLS